MSDMDQRLKQALGEQTEGVRVVADLAERAIDRDRSNRRRELGVAALAAGLVLAVAVPVGWGALRPTDVRPLPVGPSRTTAPTTQPSPSSSRTPTTPTPTAVPTLTADGAPAPVTLRPADGEVTGSTPEAYVVDGVIHDGATQVRLQSTKIQAGRLTRLAGGRWIVSSGGTGVAYVVDSTGASVARIDGADYVAAQDGTLYVVADDRGNLTAYDPQGGRVAALGVAACDCPEQPDAYSPGLVPVGIVGSTVYANRGNLPGAIAWDVTSGDTQRIEGHLTAVNAAQRTALVSPDPAAAEKQVCNELRELPSGTTRWRLCAPLVFRSFSTDGSYLLATGYIDGLDESQLNPDRSFRYGGLVVVRTSDAAVVLEGGGDGGGRATGSPVTYRMGDDAAITVQVGGANGKRTLQRCTLQGDCEVVAPSRGRADPDIPEGEDPYFLSDN